MAIKSREARWAAHVTRKLTRKGTTFILPKGEWEDGIEIDLRKSDSEGWTELSSLADNCTVELYFMCCYLCYLILFVCIGLILMGAVVSNPGPFYTVVICG
jgi:hypothetical protein